MKRNMSEIDLIDAYYEDQYHIDLDDYYEVEDDYYEDEYYEDEDE